MTEKILLLILLILYLSAFVTRNFLVKSHTGKTLRSRNLLPTLSIVCSSLCFIVTILSTFSDHCYHMMGAILFLKNPFISYIGLFIFGICIIIGWFVSAQLKDSWRVGVLENQQTSLIKDGIYAYIRNPYFLSYYIMFFSLFLVRPSIILLLLFITTGMVFHRMVIKEETHLRSMHGEEYKTYMSKTGRYIYATIGKKQIALPKRWRRTWRVG